MHEGFFSFCLVRTERRLDADPEGLHESFDVGVRYTCERCGEELSANAEASVIRHPAVVAFCYERGVDVSEAPLWELEWAVRPTARVVSESPLRAEVPVECKGDRLVLTLDEHAEVVAERRE
jgi:hypothetical protein